MGFLRGIGSFFKRQAKTKTGKLAMGVVVGAVAPSIPVVGEMLPQAWENIAAGQPILDTVLQAGALMFLRDGAARKGE